MTETERTRKKLRVLLIVLIVLLLPALGKLVGSGALNSIRNVDVALLFGSGFATGAFVVTLVRSLQLRKG